ncbi:MAG: hypothetical protein HWE27_15700 [Gammaproteobacteria bacterium]|nr:hypothetical protein [Gammaproteobacteria bacterium]
MSTIVNNPVKQTKVIMLNGRYFSRFGKKGQVQTAWCLAGAKSFNESCDLNPVLKKLDEKGKKYTVERIELFERVDCYPPKELFKLRYRLERMMNPHVSSKYINNLIKFESSAPVNFAERLFLTTMQWQVAVSNNSEKVNKALDWYFIYVAPTSQESEWLWQGHLIGRSCLDLKMRLEIHKARKQIYSDDVPF